MSLYVDEYLATGEVPGPRHNILTGRYACYDVYRCADDRWLAVGAIEPHFYANLCRALGCEQWLDAPDRRRGAGRDPRRLRAPRSRTRDARRVGRRARPGRHLRVARSRRCPSSSRDAHFRARDVFVDATARRARRLRAGRLGARGHGPRRSPVRSCATRPSPTPTRCCARPGYSRRRDRGAARGRSGGVSDTTCPPTSRR